MGNYCGLMIKAENGGTVASSGNAALIATVYSLISTVTYNLRDPISINTAYIKLI